MAVGQIQQDPDISNMEADEDDNRVLGFLCEDGGRITVSIIHFKWNFSCIVLQ